MGAPAVERPILFSGRMVCAVLDRFKTQTRRVIKPQPIQQHHLGWIEDRRAFCELTHFAAVIRGVRCPYGSLGDSLWVRETWSPWADKWTQNVCAHNEGKRQVCVYRADYPSHPGAVALGGDNRWHSSIHMPRAMSRIDLRVKDIRVERVWDITEEDARAEGLRECGCGGAPHWKTDHGFSVDSARECFKFLWNDINEKRGYGWKRNPWVWVITFSPIMPSDGRNEE